MTNLRVHIFSVYTMSIPRTLLVCTFMCILLAPVNAWWPFSSSSSEETDAERGSHLKDNPVPFEMTTAEEKFLDQAKKYMGDLSPLDSCHQIVSTEVIHYGPVHSLKLLRRNLETEISLAPKTHRIFVVHTTSKKFENATVTGHFGFVLKENLGRGILLVS